MKFKILLLIFLTFLQATILPINILLIVLILLNLIAPQKANLYLAFFFGLFSSLLSFTPLGINSLIFLIMVILAQLFARFLMSHNLLTIIPFMFLILAFNNLISSMIFVTSIQILPQLLIESALALPIYLLLKFWEDRLAPNTAIKLKM